MLIFYIVLFKSINVNKVCIESLQMVWQNETNLENLVSCAFMSIVNYNNKTHESGMLFTNLHDHTKHKRIPLPFCESLLKTPIINFFGPGSFCASLLTKTTMCRIDAKIHIKMKEIYATHIITKKHYESMQILICTFIDSFFVDITQRIVFLDEFVKRSKSMFNQSIKCIGDGNNIENGADQCLHYIEEYKSEGKGFISKCVDCKQNGFHLRDFFDYNLIYSMLSVINEYKYTNRSKLRTPYEKIKLSTKIITTDFCKNQRNIAIFFELSIFDISYIEFVSIKIIKEKTTIEQKRTVILQYIDNIERECYDYVLCTEKLFILMEKHNISEFTMVLILSFSI